MRKAIVIILILVLLMALPTAAQAAEYTDAELIAKVIYAEARGESVTHQAAVAWCVLNRVDDERWADSVHEVVRQYSQFAYSSKTPVTDEHYALAQDVLLRWELEQLGVGDVGRVLPREYVYFAAKRGENRFRTGYRSRDYWTWETDSPYEEVTP